MALLSGFAGVYTEVKFTTWIMFYYPFNFAQTNPWANFKKFQPWFFFTGYNEKASFKKYKCAELLVVCVWNDLQCCCYTSSRFWRSDEQVIQLLCNFFFSILYLCIFENLINRYTSVSAQGIFPWILIYHCPDDSQSCTQVLLYMSILAFPSQICYLSSYTVPIFPLSHIVLIFTVALPYLW